MENRLPQSQAANIKVFCRFRPFNAKEAQYKVEPIFRINQQQLVIKDSKDVSFMFDQIYDMDTTQQRIYDNVGKPILANILDGFNGTILAYGQTSSGKTHTMQGYDMNDKQIKGIIPRIIENLFQEIEKSPETIEFKLKVSIFELYMQKIRDLLDISKTDLKIRQNKQGPYVQNLTEAYIGEKLQLYKLVHLGQKNRITCATNMNQHSSRSHLIFLLTLNQYNSQTNQSKTSKLFLIDLAGSEKISKTGAEGKALEQAKKINLSLTSLGKVIKSLSQKITHIPYRDSKLTRIIKDSLGGNSKTTLIVTCSPHGMHLSQTISTLRFGESAQKIKNKPKINRQLTVQELQKMIQKLQSQIQYKDYKILALQNYIKTTLNAQVPKLPSKLPPKLKQQSLSCTVSDLGDFNSINTISQMEQYDDEEFEMKGDQLLLNSVQFNQKPSNISGNNYASAYEEQIASLEAQISTYKKNLQSELAKFYQLKKEYNNLNESLKGLIQQNISYQEQIKEFEDEKVKYRENVQGKYKNNCKLIFGQIGHLFKNGDICSGCFEKVDELIGNKGTFLLDSHEKQVQTIDCYDYWKEEKQVINKKMEQVINKSININNILDKKYPQQTTTEPPPQTETNEKLIQLQGKFDKLYQQYQDMLVLQTNWKVQCQLYQRKLKTKEQKISELKQMLDEISEQMEFMTEEYDETMSVNTKIVKPVRGGFLFK